MFKVGDKVKVVRKVDYHAWVSSMDKMLGSEGKIERQHKQNRTSLVSVDGNGHGMWFPDDCLEKVNDMELKNGDACDVSNDGKSWYPQTIMGTPRLYVGPDPHNIGCHITVGYTAIERWKYVRPAVQSVTRWVSPRDWFWDGLDVNRAFKEKNECHELPITLTRRVNADGKTVVSVKANEVVIDD